MKLPELERAGGGRRFGRGLVIGKFYPPHRGHRFLIETAVRHAAEVDVIICDQDGLLIPARLRERWIREMVPAARTIIAPDVHLADDDSKGWAEYTIKILGRAPDAVFTSEDYGDKYAEFLGATHVSVDRERVRWPVSGTQVRQDPYAHWERLDPPVRGYFAKRVVVVGAESTGTTTLARDLAGHYRTAWVPEYGRTYWEGKMNATGAAAWRTEEFVHIAATQNETEDRLARTADRILFCDTDSFATSLWHERYMGFWSPEVERSSAGRKYDWYFLTGDEIPFVQDGTRDGEDVRHKMHERFQDELRRQGKPFTLLSGSRGERLREAVAVCDRLLADPKWPAMAQRPLSAANV
jgi:HTH-type transcriptional regulator, transcriptional repressor of NAD biosynthesis genes